MVSEAIPASGYEDVPTKDLKPHPRNYRGHPDDQIDHIVQSLTDGRTVAWRATSETARYFHGD